MIASMLRDSVLPVSARVTPRPEPTGEDRILILQPDHLGDIILSEPAVRYLRSARPDSELIAVIGPWSADITRMAWPVDRIVELDYPGFTRRSQGSDIISPYAYLIETARSLRREGASDALVLRDDAWWAAWLARASVGGNVVASSDHRVRPFATIVAPPPESIHRTAIAMEIVSAFIRGSAPPSSGAGWDMSPRLLPDAIADGLPAGLHETLEPSGSHPYIVVHPGSGARVKTWPIDRWRYVLRALEAYPFIITGTESERDLCAAIAEDLGNATSIAGQTPLPALAYVLQGAKLAAGTDNGPMHLAGAVGTPTVRLFGPSEPDRYGPWPDTPNQHVLSAGWHCPRCGDLSGSRPAGCGCMTAIDADHVVDAIRTALSSGN